MSFLTQILDRHRAKRAAKAARVLSAFQHMNEKQKREAVHKALRKEVWGA